MAKVHPGFTLTQLIENTADELRKLSAEPKSDAVMKLAGCELELAVTVGAEAGGKFRIWLVDVSAKGHAETASRVKLSFIPIDGTVIAAAGEVGGDIGEPPPKRQKKK